MGFRTHRRLRLVRRCVIEPEVRNVLRADDAFTPPLQKPGGVHRREPVRGLLQESAHRTSAAFAPPKKLPPGCGTNRAIVTWRANSRPRCNRYVVSREERRALLVAGGRIRYHRSDTALVRIWIPVVGNDEKAASRAGVRFVHAVFPVLRQYLPS